MTDSSGHLLSATRQAGRGAPTLEGWYVGVTQNAPALWQEFETAIGSLAKTEKPDELARRLVDALNWFGQALVEVNPAAKVVKYTAALERLTITGHVDQGLEATLIKRVTLLNSDRTDKSLQDTAHAIGQLYQIRSDLIHGSLSPYDSSVEAVLRIGWDVTRWSLLRAALIFRALRAEGKANRKELGAFYDRSITSQAAADTPGA